MKPLRDKTRGRFSEYALRNRHGLTVARLRRMLAAQGEKCAICASSIADNKFAIDHDHRCCSGRRKSCGRCVRGLLCRRCNILIGYIESTPRNHLEVALQYLAGGKPQPKMRVPDETIIAILEDARRSSVNALSKRHGIARKTVDKIRHLDLARFGARKQVAQC